MRPGINEIITKTPRRIELTEPAITAYLDRWIRYWQRERDRADKRSRFRVVAAVRLNAYQAVRQNLIGRRLIEASGQEEMGLGGHNE
jgi:hypothetical protein